MASKILVATPHAAFGELIRQSLQEIGSFIVEVATTQEDALRLFRDQPSRLAILDADLKHTNLGQLARALLELQPGLLLVLMPPNNNPDHPDLAGLPVQACLNKPFYLPDLIGTVERLVPLMNQPLPEPAATAENPADGQPVVEEEPSPVLPFWLTDQHLAARSLSRLAQTNALLGSLIVNGDQVWAYSGELPETIAPEVLQVVNRSWNSSNPIDLARYMRFSVTGRQYLVYMTALTDTLLLALICDAATPFSRIRGQVGQLVESLFELPPPAEPDETELPAAPLEAEPEGIAPAEAVQAEPDQPEANQAEATLPEGAPAAPEPSQAAALPEPIPAESGPSAPPVIQPIGVGPVLVFDNDPVDEDWPDDWADLPPLNLPPLLDDVPPPDPAVLTQPAVTSQPVAETQQNSGGKPWWLNEANGETPEAEMRADLASPGSVPADEDLPVLAEQPQEQEPSGASILVETPATQDEAAEPAIIIQPLDWTAETATELAGEPPVYTYLLAPRAPEEYLTGKVATRLNQCFRQICREHGWRLEGISVRPNYVQWTVRVPEDISPDSLVRIFRQRTTDLVYLDQDKPAPDNGADFWAPGYLLLGGVQVASAQLVREFIHLTRQKQRLSS